MTTLYGLEDLAIGTGENITRLCLFEGPLDLGWKHCAITSDFVAEFVALRYRASRSLYKEVRHNVGYLTNELIENAVKFRAAGEIVVEASIEDNVFRAKVSNLIEEKPATQFQHLLSQITMGDPGELLIKRIEANAIGTNTSSSGLGLLTLMSDYGAHFAWVFGSEEPDGKIPLETYASIAVPNVSN
ncbi:ATP-binding protein [Neorhizobium sp. Rsf11]|uniref:ATP-binding protein n=2 Tax=Neorhizobium TaxID=1525371 RepID=A0ABV0M2C8_9HYPH|nr:ATP-binding protein [Neorhizobium petrolearium]MCC2612092.1 ATP-binding protein [Neorhizobium petrolearium]WGI67248.1 ATP-binding protein [Neorhizobium petrolearium]